MKMNKRTASQCIFLVMALALLLLPSVASAADIGQTKIDKGQDMFAQAGIKSGDICTIYYTQDGAIDKIVKGTPDGVKVETQVLSADSALISSLNPCSSTQHPISAGLYVPWNPWDRGPTIYCDRIYFLVTITANCRTFFGMYNVNGNYATGQYFLNPPNQTVSYTIIAWNDYWKHQVSYDSSSPVDYVTGYSYY